MAPHQIHGQAIITLINGSVIQFIKGVRECMKAKSEQRTQQQEEGRERANLNQILPSARMILHR